MPKRKAQDAVSAAAPTAADEFYRVPLSSGEAVAVLALLHALPPVFAVAPQSAIDPAILMSAAERLADELPEFAADKAKRLADELTKTLTKTLNQTLARPAADTGKPGKADRDDETLSFRDKVTALELALDNVSPVEIKYYVASRDEWTRRIVDISDVYEEEGKWYLEGYCRLRRDRRVFRVDNIGSVRLRDDDVS